jgi:hypothetical protein
MQRKGCSQQFRDTQFCKGDFPMKKGLACLLMVVIMVLLMLATTVPAFASGGQVRGGNAQGSSNQVQVHDPPPFQP